jgi:biotin carboxyl carrier protein
MISGRTLKDKEFLLNNEELNNFLVDHINIQNGEIALRKYGKKFDCRIIQINKSKNYFVLKVNGQLIELTLSYPIEKTINKIGLNNQNIQEVNNLSSPMPGLILDINVKVGDTVKKDQQLIILEAMKMENVLTSPVDGKIKEIKVKPQQTVEKNNILITFEK